MPGKVDTIRVSKRALFEALGYTPHAGQVDVHRSRAPRRVLACGVRWGKSLCAGMEALAAALHPASRSVGWVVAPTFELADKIFREVVVVAAEHLRHRIVTLREHDFRLVLRNLGGGLSEIRGKSADNPVSLLGEGLDYLIVDEAARMKPSIWDGHLSQRLIDKKGWSLVISTPKGKGWFYDHWRRGQGADSEFVSWNLPSWSNPHLDRAAIERERERLPDRVFRQEYAAEFVEGSGQVFRNVRDCATGELEPPCAGVRYFAGLDLAKVADYSVLVIMNANGRVVYIDRFNKIDWGLQVTRIKAASERYGNATVLVDTTGAGEPIFESLHRADVWVSPYPFTNKSKAALVDNLSLLFERREIILPRPEQCPELIDELEAFEYSVTDQGTVRTSAPSGIHDDCVMALGLAAWQMAEGNTELGITRF